MYLECGVLWLEFGILQNELSHALRISYFCKQLNKKEIDDN